MVGYTYDGSFEGLLTAVYEAYYRREAPEYILARAEIEESIEGSLFVEQVHIPTDLTKSEKVYASIRDKISSQALHHVCYAFLSEMPGMEMNIFHYLKLGWKVGGKVDMHLADERVHRLHRLSMKVRTERHRMLGLIRFRLLSGNIFYAPIEPDYHIVPLVAPHFARRMADQNWVIHDIGRGIAALYNQKEWIMTDLENQQELAFVGDEENYQELWKGYFKSMAIQGRINPKLQRRFMPARYWSHLVEMEGK